MAKKQTRAELQTERDQLNHQNWALSDALNLSLHTKPDATETVRVRDNTYTFQLYGSKRASGGIVLRTFRHAGQSPLTCAYYLDEYARDFCQSGSLSDEQLKLATAIDRLRVVRNRLVEVG